MTYIEAYVGDQAAPGSDMSPAAKLKVLDMFPKVSMIQDSRLIQSSRGRVVCREG